LVVGLVTLRTTLGLCDVAAFENVRPGLLLNAKKIREFILQPVMLPN
jgi:hypothetical protein